MCEYCKELKDNEFCYKICGKNIKLKKTANPHEYEPFAAWISKVTKQKDATLMIEIACKSVYMNINFCPICGRKLTN